MSFERQRPHPETVTDVADVAALLSDHPARRYQHLDAEQAVSMAALALQASGCDVTAEPVSGGKPGRRGSYRRDRVRFTVTAHTGDRFGPVSYTQSTVVQLPCSPLAVRGAIAFLATWAASIARELAQRTA